MFIWLCFWLWWNIKIISIDIMGPPKKSTFIWALILRNFIYIRFLRIFLNKKVLAIIVIKEKKALKFKISLNLQLSSIFWKLTPFPQNNTKLVILDLLNSILKQIIFFYNKITWLLLNQSMFCELTCILNSLWSWNYIY